jgi:hypothetical protein
MQGKRLPGEEDDAADHRQAIHTRATSDWFIGDHCDQH